MIKLRLMVPLVALLLSACGRLDAPVAGDYRAYVELRGGQAPFELRVNTAGGATQLWRVQDGKALPATDLRLKDGTLQAQLPDIGLLQARMERKQLKGEVRLTDIQGNVVTLPFAAELNQPYRFVEQTSTDNADVSGDWQLEAISPQHFSVPVTLRLTQTHDAVDGRLLLESGNQLKLYGQVQGDEVYLSGLGAGRALLFKGKVNAQGELQGELWTNLSTAQTAIARRMTADAAVEPEEVLRQVALPWAVPTR